MSEKYLEKILQLSKKAGLKDEEVRNRFNEATKETGSELAAYKKLRVELSEEYGSLSSSGTQFYAYIIGDSGLYDRIENMRNMVTRMLDNPEMRERAIQSGRATEDGTVLDFRKKNRFGKDNPKYGLPLEGQELHKDLLAIVSSDPTFQTVRLAEIPCTDSDIDTIKDVHCFNWYAFRGNIGKIRPESENITVYLSSGTKFRNFTTNLTPVELANKIQTYSLEKNVLEKLYSDKYEKKPNSRFLAVFSGMVEKVFLEPKDNRRSFSLIDESGLEASTRLYCSVNLNIPVVFREFESIVAVGRLWKSRRNNSIGMEVRGYIPLGLVEV